MNVALGRVCAVAVCLLPGLADAASAVDIAPHRAVYSLALDSAKQNSAIVGADGNMAFEWGETCDGWTVEQRYQLSMHYEQEPDVELSSNFVTWESKDGLRYRFFQRKVKNGDVDQEVRGEATLDGKGKGGKVDFTKPTVSTIELPPGVVFPTAHTLLLIERAAAGDSFVAKKIFDGSSQENAVDVTAVIGGGQNATAGATEGPLSSPLLKRPSWRMRLAFFPPTSKADAEPDYELGMRLLDNGVSRDMVLDYGDFVIRAKLGDIQALPKPSC